MNQEQNRRLYQNAFIKNVGSNSNGDDPTDPTSKDVTESERDFFKRYIEEQERRRIDDQNLSSIQRTGYLNGVGSSGGVEGLHLQQQLQQQQQQQFHQASSTVSINSVFDLTETNQRIKVNSNNEIGIGVGGSQMIPKEFLPSNQGGSFGAVTSSSSRVVLSDGKQLVQQTVYNIDSRDRDTHMYPTADHFIIQLGKIYQNIKQVELVSTEFPNTDKVIKDTPPSLKNNNISWVNAEDSGLGTPFPEYSVDITPGNYTVSTLTDEMKLKMNAVKRSSAGGTKNHFFDIIINLDTDIVKIRSLNLTNLTDNPVVTIADSNLVYIYVQDAIGTTTPTWSVGDSFYLTGVKGFVGGINPRTMNGFHTVVQTSLDDGGGGTGPMVIDETNFVLDFQESGTSIFAALEKQVYATPALLATEIGTKMTSASTIATTYTVDYNITTPDRFTISGTAASILLFGTGTNIAQSVSATLGFAASDTASLSVHVAGNNLTNNTIQIELPIDAVFTDNAGGNGVRAGNLLPFKFLFGKGTDFTNYDFKGRTVAGVLGYPEEDSSSLVGASLTTLVTGISNMTIGSSTSIETSTVHGLLVGDKVQITGIISIPSISATTNAIFIVSAVNSVTNFSIPFATTSISSSSFETGVVASNKVIVSHPAHGLVTNDLLTLYRCAETGGLLPRILNGTERAVTVIDAASYSIEIEDIFPKSAEAGGGGGNVRASCYLNSAANTASNTQYGFDGLQDNTSDGTNLNQSVNLDGENYVLLTSPTLGTFSNSGLVNNAKRTKVEDVFAKMLLTGAPGSVIFNSFVTSPKVYDFTTKPEIEFLEFTVKRQDNNNYNFYGLDYSFAILITEVIDKMASTAYNSRRGVSENI